MTPAEIIRLKELLPTSLGSDEIRERFAADILRRSVFSARMASAAYLKKIREVCVAMSEGTINQADARAQLLTVLEQLGHSPLDDGGLKNPASIRRLNLILETQTQMAASVARLSSETPDTLSLYPAWELTRSDAPAKPREDWPARWNAAGNAVGWKGAYPRIYHGSGVGISFVALKDSPIWAALGAGVGGFSDTLGNPYPPFAYSSYMDWLDLDRQTCIDLGLISESSTPPDSLPTPSISPDDAELIAAARQVGFPSIFDDLIQ